MKIKGNHVLVVDKQDLWPLLQDPEVLARISPGVSRIEAVGDDKYTAISDISIGPVRGSFEGELSIIDKVDLETMTLVLSQKSKIGNAQANIVMNLSDADQGGTEVSYNGSAKVSGTLATMGQRIIGGVVKTLTKQVFKELEKIIEERGLVKSVEVSEELTQEAEAEIPKVTEQTENKVEQLETTIHELEEESKGILESIIDKIKSIWKSLLG